MAELEHAADAFVSAQKLRQRATLREHRRLASAIDTAFRKLALPVYLFGMTLIMGCIEMFDNGGDDHGHRVKPDAIGKWSLALALSICLLGGYLWLASHLNSLETRSRTEKLGD